MRISTEEHPELVDLLAATGHPVSENPEATVVPLRTGGDLCGLLLTFHASGEELEGEHIRLLQLICALISAPMDLLREKVSQ